MVKQDVGMIGVGNCGCQTTKKAEETCGTLIDTMYLNTSAADLAMIEPTSSLIVKIGNVEEVEGSGKNRSKMKEYLKKEIPKILQNEEFLNYMEGKRYVYIVASAAGGTGSGAAPVLLGVLRECFPDTHFILVAVLPQLADSMMEQGNAIEFLDELYGILDAAETTYMIYDNETTADRSPIESLRIVNEAIVEDIRVLTGVDNYGTGANSIDEADFESIITTPGRLHVTRIKKDLTEKVLEDVLIDDIIIKAIKKSCHTETDRNKKVERWGIITNMTEEVYALYTSKLEKLTEFIGTPRERFNHNAINDKGEEFNFFYLIAAGLSPINDRVKRIRDRITALQNALAKDETKRYMLDNDPASASYNASAMRKKEERAQKLQKDIAVMDIFTKFQKK